LTSTRSATAARRLLVIGEVALASVLLIGAGLLLRSVERMLAIDPGFSAEQVLTMQVQVPSPGRMPGADEQHQFFARIIDAVRRLPDVSSAAVSSQLPLTSDQDQYGISIESSTGESRAGGDAFRYTISPDYFAALGIPLRRGRLLTGADMTSAMAARPVVINETLARQLFGGREAIGQRLRFAGPATRPFDVVVGIVGDLRQTSLIASPTNAVYTASGQWLWADNPRWLVVRTRVNTRSVLPAVKQAVWSVDPNVPISRIESMEDLVTRSVGGRRFALVVFQAFALAALVIAATGIFGVLAGGVSERLREIGVRAALGASHREIVSMVVWQGVSLAAIGVAAGMAGALVGSRALVSMLFEVTRFDPVTYIAVAVLFAVVSLTACWVPAWRAARVDPVVVLRAE
jgi:putative ABC transport system permease protein